MFCVYVRRYGEISDIEGLVSLYLNLALNGRNKKSVVRILNIGHGNSTLPIDISEKLG